VGDDANVMLNGFGTVVNALGKRAKPYLPQICGTIKWRLNNKAAKIRQQAADLIARIAPVLKACEEEQLLIHLGVVLYEYLGEEVGGRSAGVWSSMCAGVDQLQEPRYRLCRVF
jgi:splicing factor 3B subunit 1